MGLIICLRCIVWNLWIFAYYFRYFFKCRFLLIKLSHQRAQPLKLAFLPRSDAFFIIVFFDNSPYRYIFVYLFIFSILYFFFLFSEKSFTTIIYILYVVLYFLSIALLFSKVKVRLFHSMINHLFSHTYSCFSIHRTLKFNLVKIQNVLNLSPVIDCNNFRRYKHSYKRCFKLIHFVIKLKYFLQSAYLF